MIMENKLQSDDDDSIISDIDFKEKIKPMTRFERAKKLRQVKKALRYLETEKKAKELVKTSIRRSTFYPVSRNVCTDFRGNKVVVDKQVQLHCRQIRKIVEEIRKSVLQQNWKLVKILLGMLCNTTSETYLTMISKTMCLLLFSHPQSNLNVVQDFIRLSTGYLLTEDVNKYIRILFALRKTKLPLSEKGHLLKGKSEKVIYDPEYAVL